MRFESREAGETEGAESSRAMLMPTEVLLLLLLLLLN